MCKDRAHILNINQIDTASKTEQYIIPFAEYV